MKRNINIKNYTYYLLCDKNGGTGVHSHSLYREFHVRRKVRQRYGLSHQLFALNGNVVFANQTHVEEFANQANSQRAHNQQLKIAELNAVGLIHEIWHYIIDVYKQKEPHVWATAVNQIQKEISQKGLTELLVAFLEDFPPSTLIESKESSAQYLAGKEADTPIIEIEIEELLLVHLANRNLAFGPYLHMFEDIVLQENHYYKKVVDCLKKFFGQLAAVDHTGERLYDALYSPIRQFPEDVTKQLAYLLDRFGLILSPLLNQRTLSGLDLLREENKDTIKAGAKSYLPPMLVAEKDATQSPFLKEKEWMTDAVILTKNTLVWLHQLGKEYGHPIHFLDEIPDQELDRIAEAGFNCLWLIGIWERSMASKKIKQMLTGRNDVEASAYSLYDYQIARQLGGQNALESLRARAFHRGIRMVVDMVANHTGVDSRLVTEHPEYFMQRRLSPYPQYTFNSENLCSQLAISVHLEDHYYTKKDRAVVFKRVDNSNNHATYIYHGNDGSGMPWCDTAQLDFSNPETREMVIQQILRLAKEFPIIHFDSAMVLIKRQIQRLWFPLPGHGGDIASRKRHNKTVAEFDEMIPEEFWKEVVDRVEKEAPNTLLITESFSMMEVFFIRSLGMHRVYNGNFMHMLKTEKNAKYRAWVKKALSVDPDILGRFVNFLSNPNEDAAITQFGKEEKYIGICVMMCTMPGMPLFAHGQVRGLKEKYGHEYTRPHMHESQDLELISRHRQEIFPLLHKRYRFSGTQRWRLYDFIMKDGKVDENVFAYSNTQGLEYSIVVYNNANIHSAGHINVSVPFVTVRDGGKKENFTQTLADSFCLHNKKKYFLVMRDHRSGLWHLYRCADIFEKGLFFVLEAYEYHIFWEIHERFDHDGQIENLYNQLDGAGVADIDLAMKEIRMKPLYQSLLRIFNSKNGSIMKMLQLFYGQEDELKIMASLQTDCEMTLILLKAQWGLDIAIQPHIRYAQSHFKAFYNLLTLIIDDDFWPDLLSKRFSHIPFLAILIFLKILSNWRKLEIGPHSRHMPYSAILDDWLLAPYLADIWLHNGWGNYWAYDPYLRALTEIPAWDGKEPWHKYLSILFKNQAFAAACGVNEFDGLIWYDQQKFDLMIDLLFLVLYYENVAHTKTLNIDMIPNLIDGYQQVQTASHFADCQLTLLVSTLSHDGPTTLSSRIKKSLLTTKKKTT
ncbi:MAG: alpha-amylase family glycosyl hydrolase [Spirochaetia bacterium]